MKRTIKRAKSFSNNPKNKNHKRLFKRRILKRFSYKGADRRRKYLWNKDKGFFEISHHFDWGNFLSYTNKAAKINVSNVIKRQTRRHWKILEKLLRD